MVTGSKGNCSMWSVLAVVALAAWVFTPTAFAQNCGDVPPNLSILDCNGNGVADADDIAGATSEDLNANGIPDECDFEVCDYLWEGFGDPEHEYFHYGQIVDGMDYDGDGSAWDNPELTAAIGNRGCEDGTVSDFAMRATAPETEFPEDAYIDSDYFRTLGGELDCGAAIYSLSFNFKVEGIEANRDWEFIIYDERARDALEAPCKGDGVVAQIEFASTLSLQYGVVPGTIMVRDSSVPAGFVPTGVVIDDMECYNVKIVLNNIDDTVKVYVNGVLKVETASFDVNARRMDYFRLQPVDNHVFFGDETHFHLDAVYLDVIGPALMDWADCNGNCVDDDWDIDPGVGIDPDCNGNGIPDSCDGMASCACDGPADDSCIMCNHDHQWDFETTEGFTVGEVQCQQNWKLGPNTEMDINQIVASASPFAGEPGFSGQALKLGTRISPSAGDPLIRGPITHDEQPGKDPTAEPGLEYWEFDAVVDNDAGDVFFVVWDECENTFEHNDNLGLPSCLTEESAPKCAMIEQRDDNVNLYARFNAAVWFRLQAGDSKRLNILYNGTWSPANNNFAWDKNDGRHVVIKIDNEKNNISYWKNTHVPGQADSGAMTIVGGTQMPGGEGDRQVAVLSTSSVSQAYFDNLKYYADDNCDRDMDADSRRYLPSGDKYNPNYDLNENYVLDWCEDCNRNCVLDSDDIDQDTSQDCNSNGIPDECDVDSTLPKYYQGRPCGDPPWDDIGNYYSLKGGGSFDSNENGIPDECETSLDCNANGMLDSCELSCAHPDCTDPPAGCGLAVDLGGPVACTPNGVPDECDGDCNGNGIADSCDIADSTSEDINGNDIPDECEADCNRNGVPDDYEISGDSDLDCDGSGTLDVCEIVPDCNGNDIHDTCDISSGTSQDANSDGIPDECPCCCGGQQPANLTLSCPEHELSLWRTANGVIRLTFDADITEPANGELLIEVMLSGGAFGTSYTIATDTSADFKVQVVPDPDQGNAPRILEIRENGSVLTHADWIAVHNADSWISAANFHRHYPVIMGDVNADRNVLPDDFGPIFPKIPTFDCDPCERADVNGDGNVLPDDFGPIFPHIPTFGAAKPGGHLP